MSSLLSVLLHMSSADFNKMLFAVLLQGLMCVMLSLGDPPIKKKQKKKQESNKNEREREFAVV